MNLMLNAIEAMKDTGGELTIKTELGQEGPLLISVARVPSLTMFIVTSSASSTSGWSRLSQRMQVRALVMAAVIGCFSSWDTEAASSPSMLTRFTCARSARSDSV